MFTSNLKLVKWDVAEASVQASLDHDTHNKQVYGGHPSPLSKCLPDRYATQLSCHIAFWM